MTHLLYDNQTENLLPLDQIAALPVPEPRGPRHSPEPFHGFIVNTRDALQASGYTIQREEYAVQHDGDRMFGLIQLESRATSFKFLVGVRAAHDMRFSRSLVIGTQVLVCSNLCFHGNLGVWKTKQTTRLGDRMPLLIADAVETIPIMGAAVSTTFNGLRALPVSAREGDAELVELYRRGALSASQMGRAVDEWTRPSHDHETDHHTGWQLFNAATEALKPTGRSGDLVELQRRTELVYDHCSALIAAPAQVVM